MSFGKNPDQEYGEIHSKEDKRKILYIRLVLIFVLSVIFGYSLYVMLFMPSLQVMRPININMFSEGEWKQQFPFESYIDGPDYIKTEILTDSSKKKFLRLKTVTSPEIYSGVTCYINKPFPENARLAIKWRSSGNEPALIIDVMDGSTIKGVVTEDSTFVLGETFFLECSAPGSKWETFSFPLDTLTINPSQPSGITIDGVFDYNNIRQVSISISPESDITLDIADIYFYWQEEKWHLAVLLLLFSLTGLLLILRTKPEKLFLERGTTLNIKVITPRITFILVCLSAAFSIFSGVSGYVDTYNTALYTSLLVLIIVDEFVVFIKPYPLWSLRYAIIFFSGYFTGFNGGIISTCLILIASYIPLIFEKQQWLFWVVIITAIIGYVIMPQPNDYFTFSTGLVMIVCSSSAVIIFREYLLQQHKDFKLGQAILQYEALFKKTSDAIYVLDENGLIITVNQSFERLTGYNLSELRGQSISKFIYPESQETIKKMLEANDDNGLKQYDIYFANKNGQKRTALVRSNSIYTDKQITGYQALATDITDRKITEAKLETTVQLLENKAAELAKTNELLKLSEEQLRDLNVGKDRFFSIISHDLRNPFHSLLSIADMFANDYESLTKEEMNTFTNHLNTAVKNLYKLIENLLQWANIQNGKMVYKFTKICLFDLVETVIVILKTSAISKSIQLINKTQEDLIVYADFNSINSVMQNLISNAIKFTNSGGSVTISTILKGKMVEIVVEDTGVGMSGVVLEKIFKIEVHHTTKGTANEPGTGLGLILCKEMVEHNGGTIRAESELGKGSRFIFTLPKTDDQN